MANPPIRLTHIRKETHIIVKLYLPLFPFLAALVILAACGSKGRKDKVSITATRVTGTLQVTLALDRQIYHRDTPVNLTLTAMNTANSPVTATFPSGQLYDFALQRNGQEIWRWSYERFFTQAVREQTIAAGDSLTFTEAWEQINNDGERVPPGTYEAVGTLTIMDRATTPSVEFSIKE